MHVRHPGLLHSHVRDLATPSGHDNEGMVRALETTERSRQFGTHLRRIRTEVFDESLRTFGDRIGLSASYIGKLENGEVGVPKRSTVEEIAKKLALKRADS